VGISTLLIDIQLSSALLTRPKFPTSLPSSQLTARYDKKRGGFGSAPKFPRPVEINLLFRRHMRLSEKTDKRSQAAAEAVREMILHSLTAMARGGIHDHVGGGFHRYSVDEFWHGETDGGNAGVSSGVSSGVLSGVSSGVLSGDSSVHFI
jgi:hypothetical protein